MTGRRTHSSPQAGFTLIEVMVGAFLLLIVFFGAAQYASKTRLLIDHQEHRRQAIGVAQARLENLRTRHTFDTLTSVAGVDTSYTVGNRTYTVGHVVRMDTPQTGAATVTVNLSWSIVHNGNVVPQTLDMTTILGRSYEAFGGVSPMTILLGGGGGGGS